MAGGRTGAAQGALNAGRDVLRAISGQSPVPLLTYNPGPGIYSRLERAIEAMPEAVRTQELPGLLKRYKDGVPGWELKATDLDSVIAGRDVVPREELLARVKERSPVYTHKEQVRRDSSMASAWDDLDDPTGGFMQDAPLGRGEPSGPTKYPAYGQGGKDYTEVLLTQPEAGTRDFHTHWANEHIDAVAHARYDVHDGYLRVNELQSDLGIHNRKARESLAEEMATGRIRDSKVAYEFPLEEAWADVLLKRLNLIAAQQGLKGVEIASPASVFSKVGNPRDAESSLAKMEHWYGKVLPGRQERLGRTLGGMRQAEIPEFVPGGYEPARGKMMARTDAMQAEAYRAAEQAAGATGDPNSLLGELYQFDTGVERIVGSLRDSGVNPRAAAQELFDDIVSAATTHGGKTAAEARAMASEAMPRIMRLAEDIAAAENAMEALRPIAKERFPHTSPPGYRGAMSDEMRRRIIQQGIGASVLAPLLMQDEE